MPFDWKEFLELSRILGRQAQDGGYREAFLRSAISRAYYAAFCHTRNYAIKRLGFRARYDGEDHGALRAAEKREDAGCGGAAATTSGMAKRL